MKVERPRFSFVILSFWLRPFSVFVLYLPFRFLLQTDCTHFDHSFILSRFSSSFFSFLFTRSWLGFSNSVSSCILRRRTEKTINEPNSLRSLLPYLSCLRPVSSLRCVSNSGQRLRLATKASPRSIAVFSSRELVDVKIMTQSA